MTLYNKVHFLGMMNLANTDSFQLPFWNSNELFSFITFAEITSQT